MTKNLLIKQLSNPKSTVYYPKITDYLTSYNPCKEYSTTALLSKGLISPSLKINIPNIPNSYLEKIPDILSIYFSNRGISQVDAKSYSSRDTLILIEKAFELIKKDPLLYENVLALTKSIHLIDSPFNTDINFTSPDLPYSIFISLPKTNEQNKAIRMAEAIIHEAMHLQLTLIENEVLLIKNKSYTEFSPWTKSTRPIHGLFHALYVFSIIKNWYFSLKNNNNYKIYSEKRIFKINQQIHSLNLQECKNALTKEGNFILNKIITKKDSHE